MTGATGGACMYPEYGCCAYFTQIGVGEVTTQKGRNLLSLDCLVDRRDDGRNEGLKLGLLW
jgi:hypothetical protein